MKKRLYAGVLATAMLANAASAAITVTTTTSGTDPAFDPGAPVGETMIYDFDALSPTAGNLTGDFLIETAPGTGQAAAPAGTTPGTRFLTVPNSTSSGNATLLLGGSYRTASFYWGSIDDHNTLQVLDAMGNVIHTVTGSGLPGPVAANGNQSAPASNRRVHFSSDATNIAGFRLTSTNFAFEIDSVAGAVPEPATWAMMLAGFGLVGFAARRRTTAPAVLA